MKNLPFLLIIVAVLGYSQNAQVIEIQQLIESRDYDSAEGKAKSLLANNNGDLDAIEKLGDIAAHKEDWDEAIKQYKKLIGLAPDIANYHYKYGGALGMKALKVPKLKAVGLVDDIKKAFHTAAELDPEHINARWALVELYMQLPWVVGGSKKKALSYAQELQALSKVDGYLAKGYVYEYADEPEDAERFYKLAVNEGRSVTCYTKLANLYENTTKQPEKAIQTLEEAQKHHQRNAMHYQIGKVCAKYNIELDKGEACLKTFIENHSVKDGVPVEWAYYRLAQIYRFKSDKDNAIKWIDKALAVRNNFKQALEEQEKILLL